MRMSENAREIMQHLADRYAKDGFGNHKTWNFSPGDGDTVFPELQALGLIRQMGSRGSPFLFTDAGQRWAMENRTL